MKGDEKRRKEHYGFVWQFIVSKQFLVASVSMISAEHCANFEDDPAIWSSRNCSWQLAALAQAGPWNLDPDGEAPCRSLQTNMGAARPKAFETIVPLEFDGFFLFHASFERCNFGPRLG